MASLHSELLRYQVDQALQVLPYQHCREVPRHNSSDNAKWLPNHQIEMVWRIQRGLTTSNLNEPGEVVHNVTTLFHILRHLAHWLSHADRVKLNHNGQLSCSFVATYGNISTVPLEAMLDSHGLDLQISLALLRARMLALQPT
jgi:sulfur relay (sulfurtransferase) DsrF/TusC family protein